MFFRRNSLEERASFPVMRHQIMKPPTSGRGFDITGMGCLVHGVATVESADLVLDAHAMVLTSTQSRGLPWCTHVRTSVIIVR